MKNMVLAATLVAVSSSAYADDLKDLDVFRLGADVEVLVRFPTNGSGGDVTVSQEGGKPPKITITGKAQGGEFRVLVANERSKAPITLHVTQGGKTTVLQLTHRQLKDYEKLPLKNGETIVIQLK